MTNNQVKEIERILRTYPLLQVEIKNLEIDIEDIADIVTYYPPNCMDKVDSGKVSSRRNDSMVERLALEENHILDAKLERLKDCKKIINKIDNILNILNERDKRIIISCYFHHVSLFDLSIELDMNQDYLSTLRKKIIKTYFYTLL